RTGRLAHDDFGRLVSASQELYALPLFIDDTAAITISAMRTRCRRLARQARTEKHNGLGLIVVDYLQLLDGSTGSRSENRVQEISAISRGLKALAKELDVPVLALSQLSRAVEQREDKRPQLSDLRESGSIEQDADAVMFVYRDEYYLERKQPQREAYDREDLYQEKMLKWQSDMEAVHNMAEVIIGKQRHGPTGTVKLLFEPSFTHFDNLADTSHLPEEMG
ncbi:MAG: replicative DNA helicase, partial [Rhodospirillaceae bacterium]|nr:replicative DNA helicase [Rhodospirillaceae bacterium]